MNFALTADQLALRDGVRELLTKACAAEALRSAWDSDTGRVAGLWDRLAEFGLPLLLVPEADGGLGLGAVELAVVMEELGRAAAPEPLLPTMVTAAVSGGAPSAVGMDPWSLVPYARHAARIYVERDGDLHQVEPGAATLTDHGSVDPGVPLATLTWTDSTRVEADVEVMRDRLVLGTAAQLVGVAQQLLDLAVDYAKTRHQFGVPVGSFQAVKHQLADVYVAIAFARPVVLCAAVTGGSRDASHAKLAATRAARLASRASLQVHGAIGYTYEHDLHMWLKRSWSLAAVYGDDDYHLRRAGSA